MIQLCLIRHGQTDWNLEGRYHGQSDVPLNEVGRSQAKILAQKLQGRTFAVIYASDLQRASETAAIIAGVLCVPVRFEPRLREINQGEWEGQQVEVIQRRYTELWQQRLDDPLNVRPPGGETTGEVAQRIYGALDDIARLNPTIPVVIVSHGFALATVLCKVRGIPLGEAYSLIPENTEPVWITWGD
jgi:broad specificity phosphatase PhoE